MLTAHDINGAAIWNHDQVLAAQHADGFWAIDVAQEGDYEFALARWPREVGAPVTAAIKVPAKLKRLLYYRKYDYAITHERSRAIDATYARLRVGDQDLEQPVNQQPAAETGAAIAPLGRAQGRLIVIGT